MIDFLVKTNLEEKTIKTGERLFNTARYVPNQSILSSKNQYIIWKKKLNSIQ